MRDSLPVPESHDGEPPEARPAAVSAQTPGFSQPRFRCDGRRHADCPHVPELIAADAFHHSGRVVGTRSPILALSLCACKCHADCPVSDRSDAVEWPSRCTCNGTLKMVRRSRRQVESGWGTKGARPFFLSGLKDGIARNRRGRLARAAAMKRGAGSSTEQIEEIVRQEWTRRGLDPPARPGLDWVVDEIARPAALRERVGNHVRAGRDLIGLPLRVRRTTRGGVRQLLERAAQSQEDVYEIATGDGYVTVLLHPDSAVALESLARRAVMAPSFMVTTKVELRFGLSGGVEVWTRAGPGESLTAGQLAGAVPDIDAPAYERLISVANRVQQPCLCLAIVARRRDRGREMFVARPIDPLTESNGGGHG